MARTTNPATRPAPEKSSSLAIASDDQAALLALQNAGVGDDAADGMSEVSASDFRTPSLMFNAKGKQDTTGRNVGLDEWFDSVDHTARATVRLALLELHKSNSYTVFDNREQRSRRVCASFDRVTGTMEDGGERPCKGCPDAQWRTQQDGKRRANCSEVWSLFVYDLDAQKLMVIRFKRTSLDSIRSYLQQHHLGKRPLARGGRGNIPLFTYEVTARLQLDRTGNFATPVLERGAVFPVELIRQLAESTAAVRETLYERFREVEAASDDTSFDTEAMGATGEASGKFIPEG